MEIISRPSPNKGGTLTPRYVMLHHTASTDFGATVAYLCKRTAMVSAHFVVGKAGEVAQLVPLGVKAWHAGLGGPYKDIPANQGNRYAIGIEIVNKGDGKDPYPEAQLAAIDALIAHLDSKVGVLPIIDHKTYAPKRKTDMSANFPLKAYQQHRAHAPKPPTTFGAPVNRDTFLYAKRSTKSAKVRQIGAGKKVVVHSKTATWCYVEYAHDRGYVPTSHLTIKE